MAPWGRTGIASSERHGRCGHSRLTTPSALSKVASQLFLSVAKLREISAGAEELHN
jgi:hypothetical protein